jgi:hypothetical protein
MRCQRAGEREKLLVLVLEMQTQVVRKEGQRAGEREEPVMLVGKAQTFLLTL